MRETLDTFSFEKATQTLDEAVKKYEKSNQDAFIRDACIQRFEYTYELSHKMLRRYLRLTEASAEVVEEMTFPELIRTANERELLLSDWSVWRKYRDARNMTSHTYDESKAIKVMESIPDFLNEAKHLLKEIKNKMRGSA